MLSNKAFASNMSCSITKISKLRQDIRNTQSLRQKAVTCCKSSCTKADEDNKLDKDSDEDSDEDFAGEASPRDSTYDESPDVWQDYATNKFVDALVEDLWLAAGGGDDEQMSKQQAYELVKRMPTTEGYVRARNQKEKEEWRENSLKEEKDAQGEVELSREELLDHLVKMSVSKKRTLRKNFVTKAGLKSWWETNLCTEKHGNMAKYTRRLLLLDCSTRSKDVPVRGSKFLRRKQDSKTVWQDWTSAASAHESGKGPDDMVRMEKCVAKAVMEVMWLERDLTELRHSPDEKHAKKKKNMQSQKIERGLNIIKTKDDHLVSQSELRNQEEIELEKEVCKGKYDKEFKEWWKRQQERAKKHGWKEEPDDFISWRCFAREWMKDQVDWKKSAKQVAKEEAATEAAPVDSKHRYRTSKDAMIIAAVTRVNWGDTRTMDQLWKSHDRTDRGVVPVREGYDLMSSVAFVETTDPAKYRGKDDAALKKWEHDRRRDISNQRRHAIKIMRQTTGEQMNTRTAQCISRTSFISWWHDLPWLTKRMTTRRLQLVQAWTHLFGTSNYCLDPDEAERVMYVLWQWQDSKAARKAALNGPQVHKVEEFSLRFAEWWTEMDRSTSAEKGTISLDEF